MNNKYSIGKTALCIVMCIAAVVGIGLCIWFNIDKTSDIKDAASTSMVEAVENDGVTETELDGDTDINWVKDESFDILDENPRQYIHGLVYPEYPSDSKLDIKTPEAEEETNDDAAVVEEEATEDTEEATEVEEEATEDTEEATEVEEEAVEYRALYEAMSESVESYTTYGYIQPAYIDSVVSVELDTINNVDCVKITLMREALGDGYFTTGYAEVHHFYQGGVELACCFMPKLEAYQTPYDVKAGEFNLTTCYYPITSYEDVDFEFGVTGYCTITFEEVGQDVL